MDSTMTLAQKMRSLPEPDKLACFTAISPAHARAYWRQKAMARKATDGPIRRRRHVLGGVEAVAVNDTAKCQGRIHLEVCDRRDRCYRFTARNVERQTWTLPIMVGSLCDIYIEACAIDPFASCTCSRGTNGCKLNHED